MTVSPVCHCHDGEALLSHEGEPLGRCVGDRPDAGWGNDRGGIALGGCTVGDEIPNWECTGPERHRWTDGGMEDAAWQTIVEDALRT